MNTCNAPDCVRPHLARGYCSKHYQRWQATGSLKTRRSTHVGAAQSFLSSIPVTDECVLWPYSISEKGYGRLRFRGVCINASRACLLLHKGEPPSVDHQCAHSCGNRACVNPRHLRWATGAENAADTIKHGTRVQGERHPSAKITEKDVLAIRVDCRTNREIASDYGLHIHTIRQIKKRALWKHVQ